MTQPLGPHTGTYIPPTITTAQARVDADVLEGLRAWPTLERVTGRIDRACCSLRSLADQLAAANAELAKLREQVAILARKVLKLQAVTEAARETTRGIEHWERHDAIGYDRLEKLEKLAELLANLEK